MKIALALLATLNFAFATTMSDVNLLCEEKGGSQVVVECEDKNLTVDCEGSQTTQTEIDLCSLGSEDIGTPDIIVTPGKGGKTSSKVKLSCKEKKKVARAEINRVRTNKSDIIADKKDEYEQATSKEERKEITEDYAIVLSKVNKEYVSARNDYNKLVKKCKPAPAKAKKCRDYKSSSKRSSCRKAARMIRGWNSYKVKPKTESRRVVTQGKNPRNKIKTVKVKKPSTKIPGKTGKVQTF